MQESLFDFLKVSAGFFTVLGVWFGFQELLRRRSRCGRDKDMLQFMLGGCGSCANRGACEAKKRKDSGTL